MVNRFVLKSCEDNIFGYIEDLDDFVNTVPSLPEEVLNFHIRNNRNDFLNWLTHEFSLNLNIDKTDSIIETALIMSSQVKEFVENQRLEILNALPKSSKALESVILNKTAINEESSLLKKLVNFVRKIV